MHELFRGKGSLRDCTTLMLTHDIEPAIDVVKSTAKLFKGSNPQATFLLSKQNVVSEVVINKNDIKTFGKICNDVISGEADPIIKAIYLRRHFEITDNVGLEYNLLASLFHKRNVPTIQDNSASRDMTEEEKLQAQNNIKSKINYFDYDELVAQMSDMNHMINLYNSTETGYEKVQLFRLIKDKHNDDVISKFINEAYHIENEYVMQLDPRNFDNIPEYVVRECDMLMPEQIQAAC